MDNEKLCKIEDIDSENEYKVFDKKGIHIININACSLPKKISELKLIATKTRAKIITVCETWFDGSKKRWRGVCIYIHSDLAFNPRPDLDIPKMEAIWTEILLPRCKPIIVSSCYRPKKHTDFTINLETILSKLPVDSEVIG